MIRFKVMRVSGILFLAVVLALLVSIGFLSYRLIIRQPLSMDLFGRAFEIFGSDDRPGTFAYGGLLTEVCPL